MKIGRYRSTGQALQFLSLYLLMGVHDWRQVAPPLLHTACLALVAATLPFSEHELAREFQMLATVVPLMVLLMRGIRTPAEIGPAGIALAVLYVAMLIYYTR